MTSSETNRLCRDWLREDCRKEITSEYKHYSLLVPVWNSPELNDGSETPRQALCIALGPDESFGSIDYYETRRRLGLSEHCTSIPEGFQRFSPRLSQELEIEATGCSISKYKRLGTGIWLVSKR